MFIPFQAVQGDDIFAVRHTIPSEHGLRFAEAFAKKSVGNLLYGRIQRPAAFRKSVYEKYRSTAITISENVSTESELTEPVRPILSRRCHDMLFLIQAN